MTNDVARAPTDSAKASASRAARNTSRTARTPAADAAGTKAGASARAKAVRAPGSTDTAAGASRSTPTRAARGKAGAVARGGAGIGTKATTAGAASPGKGSPRTEPGGRDQATEPRSQAGARRRTGAARSTAEASAGATAQRPSRAAVPAIQVNGARPGVRISTRETVGARATEAPSPNGRRIAAGRKPPTVQPDLTAEPSPVFEPLNGAIKHDAGKERVKREPTRREPARREPARREPARREPAKLQASRRAAAGGPTREPAMPLPDIWDERVAGVLRFLRRRLTGEYDVDEFGFDPELTETFVYPMLRLLKERYFRIETSGVENLPDGPALIVANHSGTLPIDAMMLSVAIHDDSPQRRYLRLLGADLVFRMPVLSELARKAGSTLACNADAERLLRNGEYVGVFPEGFKGIGKPYRDRYKLQRFGRGGFVSAALRTGVPIVPVSIVGAEEIFPIIGNVRPLARVAGLPYFPVTPLFPWFGPLGLLPLPSKWLIEYGVPIETAPLADEIDDPIVVYNLADQVRETIQQTLYSLLEKRPDPFG